MPWWGWVLGVLSMLLVLIISALLSFRRRVRREFTALLRKEFLGVEILSEDMGTVRFRTPQGGECAANMANLYNAVAAAGTAAGSQTGVILQCIASIKEQAAAPRTLSIEVDGDKLFPRIVPSDFFRGAPPMSMPTRSLDQTGLLVAYVVDRPNSLEYLTDAHLKDLGLDAAQLHERALSNLGKTFSEGPVLGVLEKGQMSVIKALDSHDAARLLLVPRYLPEGTVIAAGIPDMDTLALAPAPKDGDWTPLRGLCAPGGGKPLLDRPLKVTRSGFTLA